MGISLETPKNWAEFSLDISATTDENIDISADSYLVTHCCFRSGAAMTSIPRRFASARTSSITGSAPWAHSVYRTRISDSGWNSKSLHVTARVLDMFPTHEKGRDLSSNL